MAEFERLRDVFAARLERFLSELFLSLVRDHLTTGLPLSALWLRPGLCGLS
jgi:hypothetical protein